MAEIATKMLWPTGRDWEGQTGADKGRDNQSDWDREGQKRDERVRQGQMWAVSDRGGKGIEEEKCAPLCPSLPFSAPV